MVSVIDMGEDRLLFMRHTNRESDEVVRSVSVTDMANGTVIYGGESTRSGYVSDTAVYERVRKRRIAEKGASY